jgi:Apea-like HEPN
VSDPQPCEPDVDTIAIFGKAVVHYALNLGIDDTFDRADSMRAPAFSALIAMGRQAIAVPDEFARSQSIIGMLFARSDDYPGTLVNALRVSCGGQLPEYRGSDPVAKPLFALALDHFALPMLPPFGSKTSGPRFSTDVNLNRLTFRHPATYEFCRVLLADPELSVLFPGYEGRDDAPPSDASPPNYLPFMDAISNVIWSTGSGGGLFARSIPDAAISYVWSIMRLENDYQVESLVGRIESLVQLIRQLCKGRPTRLPLIAALTGSGLEPRQQIPMARGRLAGPCGPAYLFPHLDGDEDGYLVVDVEVRLFDVLRAEDAGDPATDKVGQRFQHHSAAFTAAGHAIERELTRARLAIVLASDEGVILAPRPRSWAVPNPITSSGGWSVASERLGGRRTVTIPPSVASRITAWSHRLQDHPESLWLGARRLVAAVAERTDPLDAFIDAVVCWENMFGTGDGEVGFRVCGSIATLLEPIDTAKRRETFDKLRKLYASRSRLVHGSSEPAPTEAVALRDESIRVAIEAMRRLYDRAELRDATDSSVRSRIALLGS